MGYTHFFDVSCGFLEIRGCLKFRKGARIGASFAYSKNKAIVSKKTFKAGVRSFKWLYRLITVGKSNFLSFLQLY